VHHFPDRHDARVSLSFLLPGLFPPMYMFLADPHLFLFCSAAALRLFPMCVPSQRGAGTILLDGRFPPPLLLFLIPCPQRSHYPMICRPALLRPPPSRATSSRCGSPYTTRSCPQSALPPPISSRPPNSFGIPPFRSFSGAEDFVIGASWADVYSCRLVSPSLFAETIVPTSFSGRVG